MTPKQREVYERKVEATLKLLDKKGFDTRFMDASYSALGASMRERRGTVEGWLRGMRSAELRDVQARLRAR